MEMSKGECAIRYVIHFTAAPQNFAALLATLFFLLLFLLLLESLEEGFSGRDEAADDDVLREASEIVDLAGRGCFDEHTDGFLEGCACKP